MSLTRLAQYVAKPLINAQRVAKLSEALNLPVQLQKRPNEESLLSVPFQALKSTGLQVVEAVAPATKVLTGKPEAILNAENRITKILGERATLVGLNPINGNVMFEVADAV